MSDMNEMIVTGFVDETDFNSMNEIEKDKKYKCYLSKKCNDEKFERIKKMFNYVKLDSDFQEFIGKEDFAKLEESYGKKEKRGQVVAIDFTGMTSIEVFMKFKMGVKEVLKKGYTLNEDDTYSKK